MELDQLERAIAALDERRADLGDAVVESALGPMRQRLAELATSRRSRRRQVTVLFADLSGYTSLVEKLDPEWVGELVDRVWGELGGVIVAERRPRLAASRRRDHGALGRRALERGRCRAGGARRARDAGRAGESRDRPRAHRDAPAARRGQHRTRPGRPRRRDGRVPSDRRHGQRGRPAREQCRAGDGADQPLDVPPGAGRLRRLPRRRPGARRAAASR